MLFKCWHLNKHIFGLELQVSSCFFSFSVQIAYHCWYLDLLLLTIHTGIEEYIFLFELKQKTGSQHYFQQGFNHNSKFLPLDNCLLLLKGHNSYSKSSLSVLGQLNHFLELFAFQLYYLYINASAHSFIISVIFFQPNLVTHT